MKEIEIYCEWRSSHTIEVPDDFDEDKATFNNAFDQAWLDQCDASTASLTDWGFGG